ncbi:MAG: hypothetical protein AAGE86_15260 [Pseudomonadota bacterium]
MKKIINLAVIGGATVALAACGSSDPASTEATADTVEMPANEPLEPVSEEPVEDENADTETAEVEGPPPAPVTQEVAEDAAENAVDVVDRAEAAASEAEAAAAAAAAAAAGAADDEGQ